MVNTQATEQPDWLFHNQSWWAHRPQSNLIGYFTTNPGEHTDHRPQWLVISQPILVSTQATEQPDWLFHNQSWWTHRPQGTMIGYFTTNPGEHTGHRATWLVISQPILENTQATEQPDWLFHNQSWWTHRPQSNLIGYFTTNPGEHTGHKAAWLVASSKKFVSQPGLMSIQIKEQPDWWSRRQDFFTFSENTDHRATWLVAL
jgi:hypothetical protein